MYFFLVQLVSLLTIFDYCATSRKVAGSIPKEIIEFFN
jgi:hypothetical protein